MKEKRTITRVLISIPETPPSVNTLWRRNPRGGMYLNKKALEFYKIVSLSVNGRRAPEYWNYYDVTITVYPKRKTGDIDNFIKPVLDALTKCGYWEDDIKVARVTCEFGELRKTGGVDILIKPLRDKFKTS